jgi:uncharacterized lipoprotein YbaY
MKIPHRLKFFSALVLLAAGAGCANVEVVPESDSHRTVNGTVEFRADLVLPPDAVVVVRVIDMAGTEQQRALANRDLPIGDRAKVEPVPQMLAEQTITAPKGVSIPFHIEFQADDDLMRHGLNIEARISFGGKVRFRTATAHVLTLGNAEYPHAVWVEPASR